MDIQQQLFSAALKIESPIYIAKISFVNQELHIYLNYEPDAQFKCPVCGEEHGVYDSIPRTWRHLNFFQYKCFLHYSQPRVDCPACGPHSVTPDWTRERSGFTLLFEAFVVALAKAGLPFSKIAEATGEYDKRLRRIVDYYVEKAYAAKDMSDVVDIAVDETSSRKGHNYVTVVSDQATGDVLFATPGKDGETIGKFVEEAVKHNLESGQIENITMDMSAAFQAGATEHLPGAAVTFDRFHVIKLANEAVDQVRREEQKRNPLLKKSRYVWLKNRENLTAKQVEKLVDLDSQNLETAEAYRLKITLQDLYSMDLSYGDGVIAMCAWMDKAIDSGLAPMMKLANTIHDHFAGVTRYFKSHLTNGISEGINSLIQTVKRRARGYSNMRHFINMIYLVKGGLELPNFSFAG